MSQQQLLQPIDDAFPDFFFVRGQNDARYPNSHSLLIQTKDNPREALLIDAGVGQHTLLNILPTTNITKVWLSHWHEDHSYGCTILRQKGATIACHPDDIPVLRDASLINKMYITGGTPIGKYFAAVLESLGIEDLPVVDPLESGQAYNIGNDHRIQVIHTPGHTKGHCCFYLPEARLLFLADIDLSAIGPWYGALDSNVDDFEQSIQSVMALNAEIAISSHMGLFKGASEIKTRLQQYLNIIYDRDRLILEALGERTPKTAEQLVGKRIIYKKYAAKVKEWIDYLYIAERFMINSHLTRLLNLGKIIKTGAGYVAQ
jgi:glyoxylase-like metal-dependent hydrolase (beta-lactamase superfamily II)